VQKIFGRMLRGFRGLGIDNSSIVTQVFKTPRFLAEQFAKCPDEKHAENLLNAAKIVFLRQKYEQKLQNKEAEEEDLKATFQRIIECSKAKVLNKEIKQLKELYGLAFRKVGRAGL